MTDLRRQHLVRHLHRLGARAVDELLVELGEAHDIGGDILERLETYRRLDPGFVAAISADRIWQVPLTVVPPDRCQAARSIDLVEPCLATTQMRGRP